MISMMNVCITMCVCVCVRCKCVRLYTHLSMCVIVRYGAAMGEEGG